MKKVNNKAKLSFKKETISKLSMQSSSMDKGRLTTTDIIEICTLTLVCTIGTCR